MTRTQRMALARRIRRMEERQHALFQPYEKPCATEMCDRAFWVLSAGEVRRKFCNDCRDTFGYKRIDPRCVAPGAVVSYPDVDALLRGLIAVQLARGRYLGMLLRGGEAPADETQVAA